LYLNWRAGGAISNESPRFASSPEQSSSVTASACEKSSARESARQSHDATGSPSDDFTKPTGG
jgi:hypothetical protein